MKLIVKKGSTSNILHVFIQDSSKTDGSGLTGLVHNTAGLTAYYIREGAASATVITLVTATVGTFTSSGFKEVDATNMPGIYELHPPNACLASGADSVAIFIKGATNMAPLPIEIQLNDNTAKDVYDRVGAPTGASIAIDIATAQTDLDNPAQYKATGFSVPNEYDVVIAALQTDLNNPSQYQADVSALAIEANVETHVINSLNTYDPPTRTEATADKAEILADHTVMKQTTAGAYNRDTDSLEAIRDNQATSATVAAAVWDEDLTTHNIAKSAGWFVKKIKAIVDTILAMVT